MRRCADAAGPTRIARYTDRRPGPRPLVLRQPGHLHLQLRQGRLRGLRRGARPPVDAVDLTTVHKAKGLEWRVVFIPRLPAGAFPHRRRAGAGLAGPAAPLQPGAVRGFSDADERRLFYVAMTGRGTGCPCPGTNRSRTGSPPRPTTGSHRPIGRHAACHSRISSRSSARNPAEPLTLTFSELAAYRACGFAYRLRNLLGFQPFLAPELGYGKAVHHVMRAVAEHTMRLRAAPDRCSSTGCSTLASSCPRQQARAPPAERGGPAPRGQVPTGPTKTTFSGSGRPNGRSSCTCPRRSSAAGPTSSWTRRAARSSPWPSSTTRPPRHDPDADEDYGLQLAVYTDAGRREGLDVRAAYVHDLKAADRQAVDVSPGAIVTTETLVEASVHDLRNRDFRARPGRACQRCDLKKLCRWDATNGRRQPPPPPPSSEQDAAVMFAAGRPVP